jgi:hypothetical protein
VEKFFVARPNFPSYFGVTRRTERLQIGKARSVLAKTGELLIS